MRNTGQTWPDDRLRAAFVALMTPRACRTCDYGDSPLCGHELRALKVCTDPVGDTGCGDLACPGACTTPMRPSCRWCAAPRRPDGTRTCFASCVRGVDPRAMTTASRPSGGTS